MFLKQEAYRPTVRVALLLAAMLSALAGCSGGGGGAASTASNSGQSTTPATPPSGSGTSTSGAIKVWMTTGDQTELLSHEGDLDFATTDVASGAATVIDVDPTVRYQEMVGFGGAMTDSSAWLLRNRMSAQQRSDLIQDLFSPSNGIGLSFMRLTIGASDFSPTQYSLDDMPTGQTDPQLASFSIAPNRDYLLPTVKEALAANSSLRLMATPWSAPGWMKTTGSLIQGTLKSDAYAPYAQYLKLYLDAYKAESVPIYALTIQNEPNNAPADYPGMLLDASQRTALIGGYVGPLLAQSHPETRILDWDHNWDHPESPTAVLSDSTAANYISGVAWHCYAGTVDAQTTVHNAFPGKDTYLTECSGGGWATNFSDNLQYDVGTLIIGATRGWAKSVLLWNLALDENSGPHTGGCTNCRGIVTINSTTGAVTRNVEYYALAHASKFVRSGAQRIASNSISGGIQTVAFRNADDASIALLVANPTGQAQAFAVRVSGRSFSYSLPARSVATLTWSGT